MGFVDPREEVLCSTECTQTDSEEMFMYTSITAMHPGNSKKHQSILNVHNVGTDHVCRIHLL